MRSGFMLTGLGKKHYVGRKARMSMRWIGAISAAVLILFSGLGVFAAHPATITSNETGTATDLIVVKKPETRNSATTKTTYGITGTGKNGVSVAYYISDGSEYSLMKNSNGETAKTKIGAAGVFYKQVNLYEGHNKFAVRAEYNGAVQVTYFDINLLKQEVLDNMSSFTYDVQAIFTGWL